MAKKNESEKFTPSDLICRTIQIISKQRGHRSIRVPVALKVYEQYFGKGKSSFFQALNRLISNGTVYAVVNHYEGESWKRKLVRAEKVEKVGATDEVMPNVSLYLESNLPEWLLLERWRSPEGMLERVLKD